MNLIGAPIAVVPWSILLAVLIVIYRAARVTVVVLDDRLVVRNLLGTTIVQLAEVEALTTADFAGGPRPLPIMALLRRGPGSIRSRRVKMHATARVSRRGRLHVAGLLGNLAAHGPDFDTYVA